MLIGPEGLGEEGVKLGFVRALINHVEQRRSQGRSVLPDKGLSSPPSEGGQWQCI